MHPLTGAGKCDDSLGQFDPHIDLAQLPIPIRPGYKIQREWWRGGVPLDIERNRDDNAMSATPCFGGVVEEHPMGFVPETPLNERHITCVVGPHLGWLDLETATQARPVEFLDVQIGQTFTHETGPVVETVASQFEADERPDGRLIAARNARPCPPPPGFHGYFVVARLVAIDEPPISAANGLIHGSGA